jgi:two-component system, OmpR family, response regulator
MRILVVDDHEETRTLLVRNLELAGHGVKSVETRAEAYALLESSPFDVVVLDVMLPDGSGIELCTELREAKLHVPILLLTARADVRSRVQGLEAGADDYLGKPFALSELRARVHALGRRGPLSRERAVTIDGLIVDVEARRVIVGGKYVPLTAKELAILTLLALRRGRTVSREEVIEAVWGELDDSLRATLDVLVGRIRRKLGASATLLQTVRGVGYCLERAE